MAQRCSLEVLNKEAHRTRVVRRQHSLVVVPRSGAHITIALHHSFALLAVAVHGRHAFLASQGVPHGEATLHTARTHTHTHNMCEQNARRAVARACIAQHKSQCRLAHSLRVARHHERLRLVVELDAANGLYVRILHGVQPENARNEWDTQVSSAAAGGATSKPSARHCVHSRFAHVAQVEVLHLAVAETEQQSVLIVALVCEQIFLARGDKANSIAALAARIEEVELAVVQSAAHVGSCSTHGTRTHAHTHTRTHAHVSEDRSRSEALERMHRLPVSDLRRTEPT